MNIIEMDSDQLSTLRGIGRYGELKKEVDSNNLMKWFEHNGFERLGNDTHYSMVFGSPNSNKIAKVLSRYEYLGELKCAMSWFKYCRNNWQNNPHLPRVFNIITYGERDNPSASGGNRTKYKNQYYIIVVERLEEFNGNYIHRIERDNHISRDELYELAVLLYFLYTTGHQERIGIFGGETRKYNQRIVEEFPELFPEGINDNDSIVYRDIRKKIVLHGAGHGNLFCKALYDILNLTSGNSYAKCELDLHTGNLMMRGKTIVINDPVRG